MIAAIFSYSPAPPGAQSRGLTVTRHDRLGKGGAARHPAGAAVGPRHELQDLFHPGIDFNGKFFPGDPEDDPEDRPHDRQTYNCNQHYATSKTQNRYFYHREHDCSVFKRCLLK